MQRRDGHRARGRAPLAQQKLSAFLESLGGIVGGVESARASKLDLPFDLGRGLGLEDVSF